MTLNHNNFLRWEGSFNAAPFSNVAHNQSYSMPITQSSITFNPISGDTSTYGINAASLAIVLQDNIAQPAVWNSTTQQITYYPPTGVAVGARTIKYKWQDANGNFSNIADITINITARPTGWRLYGALFCILDAFGARTGDANYPDLQKYYTDDNSAFLPSTIKANVSTDPDFIPDFSDPVNCSTTPYIAWNLYTDDLSGNTACDSARLGINAIVLYTDNTVTALGGGVRLFTNTARTSDAPFINVSDGIQYYSTQSTGYIYTTGYC